MQDFDSPLLEIGRRLRKRSEAIKNSNEVGSYFDQIGSYLNCVRSCCTAKKRDWIKSDRRNETSRLGSSRETT